MTTTAPIPVTDTSPAERIRYGALIVMMMLSFLLVTAEFLPNGMLTEMADGLGITPGQAGQTVTVTALVGFIVAPTVGIVFPRLDRRTLLVWMAIAAAASNLIVAIAPNLVIILLARFLLGAALSTFWSMSITVAVRIAGPERLGRAVMFTSAGGSLATVAGVPLGVILSEAMDWRAVFAVAGIATGLLSVALRLLLPRVPAAQVSSFRLLADTIRRPGVGLGLVGHVLVVVGHFLAYTYIRLALERLPEVDAPTIIVLLAIFGVGGLAGNLIIGLIIDRSFRFFAVLAPAVIAVTVAATILLSGSVWAVGAAVFVWGFFFASWLIVVNTWVGHRTPDRLEAGGSLVVVGFQGAIMLAAGLGGLLVDGVGVEVAYGIGVAALVAGAVLFGLSNRTLAHSTVR
ncbi:putative MFS family arabinose efflux permease [Microbacterium ginsengiterrae]|uniref:Putative MFS family arabinose efflux permease n=1 Tax=Microbacterium ginsengiterrae TaxID=546115 RepID=A0A7W9CBN0_9MICO|nr:MFS transporter [Microbacterium ginsengiterrae]MBB5742548.1 putative MFS family arabinose efflux permease [Microbacterium ginsengiterrae]